MHSGEFHNLYPTPDIIQLRRVRYAGHAWGEETYTLGFVG